MVMTPLGSDTMILALAGLYLKAMSCPRIAEGGYAGVATRIDSRPPALCTAAPTLARREAMLRRYIRDGNLFHANAAAALGLQGAAIRPVPTTPRVVV
jgi:hypothetical protein